MASARASVDIDTVDDIDRAIEYARSNPDLNPQIREAFINALLDKRLRITS
jgi:hypothetical protein